jgi:hypothetical protein
MYADTTLPWVRQERGVTSVRQGRGANDLGQVSGTYDGKKYAYKICSCLREDLPPISPEALLSVAPCLPQAFGPRRRALIGRAAIELALFLVRKQNGAVGQCGAMALSTASHKLAMRPGKALRNGVRPFTSSRRAPSMVVVRAAEGEEAAPAEAEAPATVVEDSFSFNVNE